MMHLEVGKVCQQAGISKARLESKMRAVRGDMIAPTDQGRRLRAREILKVQGIPLKESVSPDQARHEISSSIKSQNSQNSYRVGFVLVYREDLGEFVIPSDEQHTYCDCEDRKRHSNVCKHLLALAGRWYQISLPTAEFLGKVVQVCELKAPTLREIISQIAYHDLKKSTDLKTKAAAAAQQEVGEQVA